MSGATPCSCTVDLKANNMERQLLHLHDHFSVTAACFLGFNLKNSTMAATPAYVAKTH